jgi:4-diphosphocytidyl-2-C-methyl-D-erythritol kinase
MTRPSDVTTVGGHDARAGRFSPLTTKAPAKLNIRLKITGQRPDGYHELVSIMVPVTLFDEIRISPAAEGIHLVTVGNPVPADETNLVFRAAEAFLSRLGIRRGLSIELSKRIPVAAGLGGGSSDAAATLVTLNQIFFHPLSQPELVDMAVRLGSDVPFFLKAGPCLATSIGEVLEPLNGWPPWWYVIVAPPFAVSTAWAYGHFRLKLTSSEPEYILNTLKNGRFEPRDLLENDLEAVTVKRFPVIETIKEQLMAAGAEGALMTGSGPCVFGVFQSEAEASSARAKIESQNLGNIFVVTQHG